MSSQAPLIDLSATAKHFLSRTQHKLAELETKATEERQRGGKVRNWATTMAVESEYYSDHLAHAIQFLEWGDPESALFILADLLLDLPGTLDAACHFSEVQGHHRQGGYSQKAGSTIRLQAVERRMLELREESPRAYRSAAACLKRIHSDAEEKATNPERLQRLFPGGVTELDSFVRWYHRARKANMTRKRGHP